MEIYSTRGSSNTGCRAEATRIREEIIQSWRDNRDLAQVLSAADPDSDADASRVAKGTGPDDVDAPAHRLHPSPA